MNVVFLKLFGFYLGLCDFLLGIKKNQVSLSLVVCDIFVVFPKISSQLLFVVFFLL